MIKIAAAILFFLFLACTSYEQPEVKFQGYDLSSPDKNFHLPHILNEISGVTFYDSVRVLAIQDENGFIYQFNLSTNEIEKEIHFGSDGDYEGIARNGDSIYILRSDGSIYYKILSTEDTALTVFKTGVPATNNEGLFFVPAENRLLVGCKNKIGKGPEYRDLRVIYSYDIENRTLSDSPFIKIHVSDIYDFAKKRNIEFPVFSENGKPFRLKFLPSEISIHPKSKLIYILSSADRCILACDMKGTIVDFTFLPANLFRKPEGITFSPDGKMIITNEGFDRRPNLLVFTPER